MEIYDHEVTPALGSRVPGPVRGFCLAILAAAVGIGCVLLAGGALRPAPGPVLLFALAIAVCVNRFVLFPSEQAATAEAAVLLAAVLGLRHDGVFLGPLAVALLVGPLDALHWGQRSFLRMAYNAGNRGLAVLAASAAFVGVQELAGSSPVVVASAVTAAVTSFAVVDVLLSATLVVLQGQACRPALREVCAIDALTVPVAFYGAGAGFLAGGVGWWALALALVPAAFVPELVIARARWHATVVRDLVVGVAVVALLLVSAAVAPVPDVPTLAVLVAIGVLAGAELAIRAGALVPPLLAVAVVGAFVVAGGDRAFFAAALMGATGTVTTWLVDAGGHRFRALGGAVVAAVCGLLAAAVFTAAPGTTGTKALAALVGGAAFETAAIVFAAREWRRQATDAVWTLPLLAAAVATAVLWSVLADGGATVFVTIVTGALALAAWWGAPPWSSRLLARRASAWPTRGHSAVLGMMTTIVIGTASLATLVEARPARLALVWTTVALGESVIAAALVGVRQWRFAPRGRTCDAGALLGGALVLLGLYPAPALAQRGWSVVFVAGVLALAVIVGAKSARRADGWKSAAPEAVRR